MVMMKYKQLVLIAALAAPLAAAPFVAAAQATGSANAFAAGRAPAQADMALLQQMVQVALARSPQLREAQASARAAGLDTQEAKGARWPTLEVTGASRPVTSGSSNPNGDGSTGRVGLTAVYNLYDAGRTRSNILSRDFAEQSARAKIAVARETVIYDTINAYLQMIKQQRIIDTYRAHIERLTTLVDKLEQVVKAFIGRRSEFTQANARLGQARDGMEVAIARQRENNLVLVRLLGSATLIPRAAQALPHFQARTPESVIPTALETHPSLLAALADIDSLKANVKTTVASRSPHVDLQASKLSGKDINGNPTPAQLYLGLRWTAFQGFAGQAAEGAALERAAAAQEKYAQAKIEIEYKIQNAWADYQTNFGRQQSLRLLALATDQVRQDYYTQWNDLGKRSLLEVLTAENDHLSSVLSLANSEVDQELALVRGRYEAGDLSGSMAGTAPGSKQ
jgi:adhesin transport system outer membrane protein